MKKFTPALFFLVTYKCLLFAACAAHASAARFARIGHTLECTELELTIHCLCSGSTIETSPDRFLDSGCRRCRPGPGQHDCPVELGTASRAVVGPNSVGPIRGSLSLFEQPTNACPDPEFIIVLSGWGAGREELDHEIPIRGRGRAGRLGSGLHQHVGVFREECTPRRTRSRSDVGKLQTVQFVESLLLSLVPLCHGVEPLPLLLKLALIVHHFVEAALLERFGLDLLNHEELLRTPRVDGLEHIEASLHRNTGDLHEIDAGRSCSGLLQHHRLDPPWR